MANLFSEALARYYEEHPVQYDANAWASRLLACPRQHAHERRQDPPVHPYLLEKPPALRHLFDYGNYCQDRWFDVLALSYPCRREVPVKARGVTGRIDILLRLVNEQWSVDRFYDIPVEIKYSQVSDPAHLWQLAAYLYAGGYPEGWLIRDRGREQEIVRLSATAMTAERLPTPGYLGYNPDGSAYLYGGRPFQIDTLYLQQLIESHAAAFLRPEDGTLVQPAIGRCLRQEGEYLVPNCAYWCWGGQDLRLNVTWEDGRCQITTSNGTFEVTGDWRRKPESLGGF